MARINYTNSLRNEYTDMYKSIEISINKLAVIENHVDEIVNHKSAYEAVANVLDVPWFFIALIHTMESSRNFNAHLHNGDSLAARTTHVPSGRPLIGSPPFSWIESAIDALKYKKLHRETDWSLSKILYNLEKYNGWGYRLYHQHVKSPYLWSYSNQYTSGKYIADGTFSDTATSRQAGAAVILRRIEQRNEIPAFDSTSLNTSFFKHSNNLEPRVDDLQRFLNSFAGVSLLVDSNPGNKTSQACKDIFGEYLPGDSRRV